MEITLTEEVKKKGVTINIVLNMIKASGKSTPKVLEVTEEYFRFLAFEACLAESNRGRQVTLWKDMLEE